MIAYELLWLLLLALWLFIVYEIKIGRRTDVTLHRRYGALARTVLSIATMMNVSVAQAVATATKLTQDFNMQMDRLKEEMKKVANEYPINKGEINDC